MEIEVIEKTLRPSYYRNQKFKWYNKVSISPALLKPITNSIDDDYLSEWEVFKFKQLNQQLLIYSIAVPIGCCALFYYSTRRIFALENVAKNKVLRIFLSLVGGTIIQREILMYPWYNRHFHEIITQPEPRGKYIRTYLRDVHPNKWKFLSKGLNDMGYNFREMNEYSDKIDMPNLTGKFDNNLI